MEDINGGLHPVVDGQSLDEEEEKAKPHVAPDQTVSLGRVKGITAPKLILTLFC